MVKAFYQLDFIFSTRYPCSMEENRTHVETTGETSDQAAHPKSSKTINTKILIGFLFVLAGLLIISGVSYMLNAQKQPDANSQPLAVVPTQPLPTTNPTADWKIYSN